MHRGAMISEGEILQASQDNRDSSTGSDRTPLIIHRNFNFHHPIPSSSFWQASPNDDELPPVVADVSERGNPKAQSENEQLDVGTLRKKQRWHRHNAHQIHGLEEYFNHTPLPNEMQRRELGIQLGLEPSQVKYWFQNKRNQVKTQQERGENHRLVAENERLRYENSELKRQMAVPACSNCKNSCVNIMPVEDEEQRRLMLENAWLKQEINRLMADVKRNFDNNGKSSPHPLPLSQLGTLEFGTTAFEGEEVDHVSSKGLSASTQSFRNIGSLSEQDNSSLMQYAISAMDEFSAMARVGVPLWIPDPHCNILVLNEQEYFKTFAGKIAPRRIGYTYEASRECQVVMMSPLNIVQIFMELNMWLVVFSSLVNKAKLYKVLSPGSTSSYSGAMQLIFAEFRVLAPVVQERDCDVLRYCKQLNEETWVVVDFSVEDIPSRVPIAKCHRRPSGCFIEGMPNGCSKITWVEHVEVPEQRAHSLSSSIIRSGCAFGAKRWISIFKRQCERLACARATANHPFREDLNGIEMRHSEGRQNLMRLAERMVINFYGGVTATPAANLWTPLTGNGVDLVRIMSSKSKDDPGRPVGIVLCASLCFWMPVRSQTLFNYLRSHSTRAEWDILSTGGGVQEISQISNGHEAGNAVTILGVMNRRVNPSNILILQESNTEPTASFVVYAPLDASQMDIVLGSGNQEELQLLPSGFTILPSGPPGYDGGNTEAAVTNGSLLTIAFQLLVETDPSATVSVRSISSAENIIKSTAHNIKAAFRVL